MCSIFHLCCVTVSFHTLQCRGEGPTSLLWSVVESMTAAEIQGGCQDVTDGWIQVWLVFPGYIDHIISMSENDQNFVTCPYIIQNVFNNFQNREIHRFIQGNVHSKSGVHFCQDLLRDMWDYLLTRDKSPMWFTTTCVMCDLKGERAGRAGDQLPKLWTSKTMASEWLRVRENNT